MSKITIKQNIPRCIKSEFCIEFLSTHKMSTPLTPTTEIKKMVIEDKNRIATSLK